MQCVSSFSMSSMSSFFSKPVLQLGGLIPVTHLKHHFNVSNSYVIRKLRVVVFPWRGGFGWEGFCGFYTHVPVVLSIGYVNARNPVSFFSFILVLINQLMTF